MEQDIIDKDGSKVNKIDCNGPKLITKSDQTFKESFLSKAFEMFQQYANTMCASENILGIKDNKWRCELHFYFSSGKTSIENFFEKQNWSKTPKLTLNIFQIFW